ncbi:MAG: PDZ domain-containing protein [Bacteroidetes bacterium]|nr:PDZ domain-containing protein [Bacteroidota bacterium]
MKYFRPTAFVAFALSGLILTGSLLAQSPAKKIERNAITLTRSTSNNGEISKEVRQLRDELNSLRRNTTVIRTEKVNESEPRPLLGIVPGEIAKSGGVTINEIIDNSGAEKAGLHEGDVVLALDGKKVQSHTDITSIISTKKPNETISVTILRNGSEQVIDATLGTRHRVSWTVTTPSGDKQGAFKTVNINFEGTSNQLAQSLAEMGQLNSMHWTTEKETVNPCEKLREMRGAALIGVYVSQYSKNGVIVEGIVENTSALQAGFQNGDIITSVSGIDVKTYPELRRAVVSHKPGESVVVTYLRDGQVQRVNTTLSSLADTRQELVTSLEAECSNVVVPESDLYNSQLPQTGIQSGDTPTELLQLTISPNPTSGIANIHFENDAKQVAKISVLDLKGAVVLTQELTAGTVDATLDLTSFPKGMYIINVNQGERKFSDKIVVN